MRNSALAALLGRQNSNSLVHQQAVQPSASREEALTAQAPRVSLQPPVWKRLFDISRFSLKKIQEETPGTSTEKTVFRSEEPFPDLFQAKMPKVAPIQELVVLKKVSLSRQRSLAKHFVKKKDWNFSKMFPEGSTTDQAIKKFRKVVNQIVSGSKYLPAEEYYYMKTTLWGLDASNRKRRSTFWAPHSWFPKLCETLRGVSLIGTIVMQPIQFSYREYSYFRPETFLISILCADAYSIFHYLIQKLKVETWQELESSHSVSSKIIKPKKLFSDPFSAVFQLIMFAPWYLLSLDLSMIKLLNVAEYQYILTPIPHLVHSIGSLLSDTANAHLFCDNLAFVLNRLLMVLLLMHTLTCLCIRQQDLSALKGDGVSEYILNASFLMTTAATVGYGDSTVDHDAPDPETTYLFGISIMISALIFFSFMQTTFSSLFKKVSAAKAVMESEYSQIEEWIIVRNRMGVTPMPRKLEKMVKGYLRYVSQHDSGIVTNSEYHGRLAYSTQIKLEKVLFHNVVIQFRFFKQLANEQLADNMLKSATTECFSEGDVIVNSGAFSKGVYLILRGNVAAVYKSHHKMPLALYKRNSHFGEFCLMNLPAYVDYVAKTPVICLMIKDTLDLRDSIRYESPAWSEIKAEMIQRIENLFIAKYDVKKRDKVLKNPATAGKRQLPPINLAANSGAYDQDAINKSIEGDDFWDSPEDNLSPIQEGDIVLNFSSKPPSSFDLTIIPQTMETKNDRKTVFSLKGKLQLTSDIPEEPTSRMQHYTSTAKNKHPSKVGFHVLNSVTVPVQPMMQLNLIKHPLNLVSANTNKSTSISSSNSHIKPLNLVRHSTLTKTTKEKQLSQPSQPTLGQSLSPRAGVSSTPTRTQVQNNLHAILWGVSDPHTVSQDWLPDESFDVLSPFHFTSSFPDRIISLSANPLHALVQSPLMLLSPDLDTSLNTPHDEEAEEQQELLRNEHERDFELISSVGGCSFGLGQYECPDINKAGRTIQGSVELCTSLDSLFRRTVLHSVTELQREVEKLFAKLGTSVDA